jgi:hypothetical protein
MKNPVTYAFPFFVLSILRPTSRPPATRFTYVEAFQVEAERLSSRP